MKRPTPEPQPTRHEVIGALKVFALIMVGAASVMLAVAISEALK